MRSPKSLAAAAVVALILTACGATVLAQNAPTFGTTPTAAEVASWNIDADPEGVGLPPGQGSVEQGAAIYAQRCAGCHGASGVGGTAARLVGGVGSLASPHPIRTVGSYWPFAPTVFDYINRAMPFYAPASLKPSEVYAVVAWLFYKNGIIRKTGTLDKVSLSHVKMPNRNGFFQDPVFSTTGKATNYQK